MDVQANLEAPCTAAELFTLVDDLAKYPQWMDLVHRADPVAGADAVWDTELRARIGPLARSKRLRMTRTEHEPPDRTKPGRVRFERAEDDGKRHAAWILNATVTDVGTDPHGTAMAVLQVELHYGGSLWSGGLLERSLQDHITAGKQRLISLVQNGPTRSIGHPGGD